MGEHITTTGIKAGEITDGKHTVEFGIEQLCSVVDHEIVPCIRGMCHTQKKQEEEIKELWKANGKQKVATATLEERSGWTKAFIIMGVGSMITTIFTLIVAVIIPALGG